MSDNRLSQQMILLMLASLFLSGCIVPQPTPAIVTSSAAENTATVTFTPEAATPTNTPEPTLAPMPSATHTPTPTMTPSPLPTHTLTPSATPTSTPMATPTATPTVTPTPLPDAVVNVKALNVRSGPGTVYDILAGVHQGDDLEVIGQAYECDWLKVIIPQGTQGWVAGGPEYVIRNLPCELIPAEAIPPTPTPLPTRDTRPTVRILIRNNTGGTLHLSLSGPAQYNFTILPGSHTISVVSGSYSYTGRGCGGATKSGTYELSWQTGDWTWWCWP